MSAERFRPGGNMKPERVKRAVLANDKEALSRMGRKGAAKRNQAEFEQRIMRERSAQLRAADDAFRRKQAGEDRMPPNAVD